MITDEQHKALSAKLDPSAVKTRAGAGGRKLSYISGDHAIREANRILGFDGWAFDVIDLTVVQCEQTADNKWHVAYTATGRVNALGVTRLDVGFGNGEDFDLGRAHESAIKEAATDALKRCLRTFGDPFGLALYDKAMTHVGVDSPASTSPKDGPSARDLLNRVKASATPEQLAEFKVWGPANWSEIVLSVCAENPEATMGDVLAKRGAA